MEFVEVGQGKTKRKIAVSREQGGSPGLFWLGGFKSDMNGSKAQALVKFGRELNLNVTRFDYSGHGQSSGDFLDGTISDWLEESLAIFELTKGPQIIIGSSMGAWLALLLNRELQRRELQKRNTGNGHALILIAPATDMTNDLMLAKFGEKELLALEQNGRVEEPSDYGEPYILTKKLLDDGAQHLLFDKSISTGCPVYILQGGQDKSVPPSHALKLVSNLPLDPVSFTMVPDGDHSLSREQDLSLLKRTIQRALEATFNGA